MELSFLCEKSGVIALVLLDLMAGWQCRRLAVRQASWLADKIMLNLEILKLYTG